MNRKKFKEFLLHKIEHGLIFHHEYDWFCYEDCPFPMLKGEVPGSGFDDVFVVGPYKTQLLAYSAYKRVGIWSEFKCVARRVCREKD